ncbi:hypothetical protein REPUB_Repub06bG0027700 [Reevesia pubescens]
MAIISLLVQIVLIVLGKGRRHIPDRWIRAVVWSAYLLADSVATIALGILSNDLGDIYNDGGKLERDNELTALWAPFFLLHLGGPDTITAYSLEDNELYLRHFFGLLIQTVVTIYIFFMAWTGSQLSYLDIPMIVADHGPNYAKLVDEYSLRHAEGFFVEIEEVKEVQNESARTATADASPQGNLIKAYSMFQIFKRLFADLILSYQEQEKSQSLFKNMTHKDAFDVIAMVKGFVYDLLYTKATKYKMVDVVITFLLLGGAIL